ncbi:hypothetical protein Ctob_002151 [Chrysochromulina tobinii]|uniref:DDT domain-containing protein n=1 Tax=Chrysochromulina tobinii TaxID=1460289 RepID=A0A0M0JB80_9EUKA|nr:hypothetical protein Ctob_002151 [Chrysochromulina tobinii]|eukprot:KOO23750.1 hypothetical protein Ctob_002151 [Chrysochromulina sp. CCMP291]
MAFLIKLVVASGGSADMLDGWTIGRLTRGDKVYSDPDGVKMISRLQVVRHLHLDEAAGKRKLDAEKEQCKLAKQEEKRAAATSPPLRPIPPDALPAAESVCQEREAQRQKREAERAAARAEKEAQRAALVAEREARRAAVRADKKAEAEDRLHPKQLCDDAFRLPARPDHSQLGPAVWDAMLPQLPKRTGASALPGPPAKAREVNPGVPSAAFGDLLFVCDFVRALGPALALPAECAAAGQLAPLLGGSSAVEGAEAATSPKALEILHRQLLHVLLADSTAGEWWAAGTEPLPVLVNSEALDAAALSLSMAPRRLPPDAVNERNWPLVCVVVALRLHEWLAADEEPLLEVPKGGTRSAHAVTPLQRAVWAIWAARPTTYVEVHAALPAAEQLALLAMLVDGASQTAAAARAAEARHAESALVAAELQPKPKPDQAILVSSIRAELARQAAPAGKKRKSDGQPAASEGNAWLCEIGRLETVRRAAERHRLQGRVELLTRAELEACELELLLDTEAQCMPVDTLGRKRQSKTLFQAKALRHALLHRRDELRTARMEAERQLSQALLGGGAGSSTRQLCAALAAGRAAALEGDASIDGVGPLGMIRGRWMLTLMYDAYVALLAQLCDDRSPAALAAALQRSADLSTRTFSLGLDRWGRRYWRARVASSAAGEAVGLHATLCAPKALHATLCAPKALHATLCAPKALRRRAPRPCREFGSALPR